MACTHEFIESVCDALAPLGEVRSRRMMGDYVVYVNGKYVITACDNIAYIKKLPCIAELMADAECGCPYKGSKEAYILDIADRHKTIKAVETLWEVLPFPKSKRNNVAFSIIWIIKKSGMFHAVLFGQSGKKHYLCNSGYSNSRCINMKFFHNARTRDNM